MKQEIVYDHPLVGKNVKLSHSRHMIKELHGQTGRVESVKRIMKENWYDKTDEPTVIEEQALIRFDPPLRSGKWEMKEIFLPVTEDNEYFDSIVVISGDLYDEIKNYLETVVSLLSDLDHVSEYAKYTRGGARSILKRLTSVSSTDKEEKK